MKFTYRSVITLYCLKRLNGERSIYGIYYILRGKKSSQSLSDSKLFGIEGLFQLFPRISRQDIQDEVNILSQLGYIQYLSESIYHITSTGEEILNTHLNDSPIPPHLCGLKNYKRDSLFWTRMSLLLQVISNLVHHNTNYIPIQKDEETLKWIKDFLMSYKDNRESIATALLNDFSTLLEKLPNQQANLFVMRLTSYNRIGLTNEQAAACLNLDPYYAYVLFKGIIHFFIHQLIEDQGEFRILNKLLTDQNMEDSLTQSARFTYKLLKENRTIDEITMIRNLKKNTIEDHLVEIAFNIKSFNIDRFVTVKKQEQIVRIQEENRTKKLKHLKQILGEDFSYFEIRLVLAKCGV
ncbi:helix-turn-helix domain-containing protein [Bacillus timonensis]|nr:helix-turn-helix domain-containing protein [Bacillus timonensis]